MHRIIRACCGAAFAAAAVLPAPLSAQDRQFTRTVALQPTGILRVEGSKGSIRLTSWDQPQVEIRATIEQPDRVSVEYARQAVDATKIDVTASSGSVSIRSNYDEVPFREGRAWRGDRTIPAIHYQIRAPRRLELHVSSDRGPLTIEGFDGTLDLVVDRGTLDLRSVSGDVRLDIDRGDRSRLAGIRGGLQLEADRTDLEVDGLTLDRNSRVDIDRGEVRLYVAPEQRLTLRTHISRRGDFTSDVPITWTRFDERRGEGHVNGGGPELTVESDRARIALRRR